jgi:hypothetical protein
MPAKVNAKKGPSRKQNSTNLKAECACLREQVKQLTAERDGYLQSLHAFVRKEFPEPLFDEEELATMTEMNVAELFRELGLNQKDGPCRKPRMTRSKSAGPRKNVASIMR